MRAYDGMALWVATIKVEKKKSQDEEGDDGCRPALPTLRRNPPYLRFFSANLID